MRDLLVKHARLVGVSLSDGQQLAICNYLELLMKWSTRINLVGSRDAQTLVVQHIVDSLAVAPHVPNDASRLVDVGSGAGLPGALLAIMRPELKVTTLEPIHKKYAFLTTVRRELALSNLHPLSQREEQHREAPGFQPYDVAVSRATFSLPEWLARGRALVRPGGVVLGMEGMEQYELPDGTYRVSYALETRTRAVVVLQA